MRMARWFGFVVLCSALSACNCGNPNGNDGGTGGGTGGSGGGTGGAGGGGVDAGPPGIALADFCTTAVTGMKEQFYRDVAVCGTAITKADVPHIYYWNYFVTYTFPEAYAGSDCSDGGLSQQMQRYAAAVSAGRLEYNGPKALECQTTGRATRDDGGRPVNAFDGKLKNPCAQIWTPKVAPGGACEADYECTGDNFCKPTSANGCGGTCVARYATGTVCTPIRNECSSDNYCDTGDDGGYQCLAKLNPGDVCDSQANPDCKPGNVCIGDTTEICLPLSKLGEPCKRFPTGGNDNCGEGTCVSDAGEVEGALGSCAPVAVVGKSCGTGFNGFAPCNGCTTCSDAGTCVDFGKAGWACTTSADCLNDFYYCGSSGQCTIKPRVNEACVVDDDNDPGNCMYFDNFCKKSVAGTTAVPGTCAPYPAQGQPCGLRYDLSSTCPANTFCKGNEDAGIGTCEVLASRDQRCDSSEPFGVSPDCAAAADYCDTRADAGGDGLYNGTCRARAVANGLCNDEVLCANGLGCDPYTAPTDGGLQKCVPPKPNGAACEIDRQCQSEWCKSDAGDTCQPKIGNGLPCEAGGDCASGVCDDQSLVCVAYCEQVMVNNEGCMNYDLNSMSGYVFFSIVLVPLIRMRRKNNKKA